MSNSSFALCLCKKYNVWLTDGEKTKNPCPFCGRKYIGKYNKKTSQIDLIELDCFGKQKVNFIKKLFNKLFKLP